MTPLIVRQMIAAELLMLRKKRATVVLALTFALGPLLIFFIAGALQHSSGPLHSQPAGGTHGFVGAVNVLGLILGPLAAIMIGAQAGAADSNAGVFRDLVATGRSRLALFAVRVPAALALLAPILVISFAAILIGTFALADQLPTPGMGLIAKSFGFILLADGTVAVVAVGLASLTTSQPATLTALIGWQLIASRLILAAKPLGSARDGVLVAALQHFDPGWIGTSRPEVAMPIAVALLVLLTWLFVFTILGAWKTRVVDA